MVISKEKYNQWISKPENIDQSGIEELKLLLDLYPFCHSTHLLYVKCLSVNKSIFFNNQLKITASNCGDRSRLFHLISEEKILSDSSENIIVSKKESPAQKLKLGQPIVFPKAEKHTFNQWLQLSKTKTIERKKPTNKLNEQINLINQFIENDPKIKVDKESFYSPSENAKQSIIENNTFVTETLAKVYLEQGHYNKAKEAYLKLSLKYPQKSSLFATQIELINKLALKTK